MAGILELIRADLDQGRRVTVMCRSASVRRGVLSAMASSPEGQAWLGVDVITVETALAEATPHGIGDNDAGGDLPEGHEWRDLVAARPRLRAHLRSLCESAAIRIATGAEPADLQEHPVISLAEGVLQRARVRAWTSLLHRVEAHGGPETRRSIIACGFAPADADIAMTHGGRVDGAWRTLLNAVPENRQCSLAPDGSWHIANVEGPVACTSLQTCHVSDVAAEARIATQRIAQYIETHKEPNDPVLVLYALPGTGERIRATLERNGVSGAADAGESLRSHGLASVCLDLAAIIEIVRAGADAPVPKHLVNKFLSSPMLVRSEEPGVVGQGDPQWQIVVESLGDQGARMSLRHLHEILQDARRSTATLDQWITHVDAWTHAALAKFQEAQGEHLGNDSDSEDEERRARAARRCISAWLVGEKLRALRGCAQVGTFRKLAELLTELGVRDAGSAAASAIRSGLHGMGDRPVSYEDLAEVLDGGTRSNSLSHRLCMMPYHEYDGRHSGLLVLLDLHSKGIAALPAPDPICDAALATWLGRPAPEQAVRERFALLRCAAHGAKATLAVVAHRGADARAVVPPLQLELTGDAGAMVHDHALSERGVPENEDRESFARCNGGTRTEWDIQVDAEWCRSGARLHEEGKTLQALEDLPPKTSSIADYMQCDHRPADVKPFLGLVGTAAKPDAERPGLPSGFTFSPSKVGKFTGCMYRGWASSIVRISAPEEKDEDLLASEIGDAIHEVLHDTLFGGHWPDGHPPALVVADADVDAVRLDLCNRLIERTQAHIDETHAGEDLVAKSRATQLRRWQNHWHIYVKKFVVGLSEAREDRNGRLWEAILRAYGCSPDELRLGVGGEVLHGQADTPTKAVGKLVLAALMACDNPAAPSAARITEAFFAACEETEWKGVGQKHQTALRQGAQANIAAAVANPGSAVCRCLGAIEEHWEDLPAVGDRVPNEGERPFGQPPDLLAIPIGPQISMPVRGKADLILARRFEGVPIDRNPAPIEVVDFKTGSSDNSASRDEIFKSLLKPQLGVYGSAFSGEHRRVVALTISAVRKGARDRTVVLPPRQLEEFGERLGSVLRPGMLDGDFALRPHPRACPILQERGRYCDFSSACRLRQLPLADQIDEGDSIDAEEDGE